ncbi:hypothetical protein GCM10022243_67560 [Saccharothrix violaceirubra]|uniref:Methyl-accepting transducer domain-containing protein n=1 Tax=Saccharothrix violaceirubra TaxID=413306 RepID=A0A7W7T2E8_9PSEU|nr:hypothetical protein [Saccharothrix violaceirubra]MBB4965293.1 hypothetical protein [Saccharothrix violaceirubra]
MITSIAEQTSLLLLNASIEAARAAGRTDARPAPGTEDVAAVVARVKAVHPVMAMAIDEQFENAAEKSADKSDHPAE